MALCLPLSHQAITVGVTCVPSEEKQPCPAMQQLPGCSRESCGWEQQWQTCHQGGQWPWLTCSAMEPAWEAAVLPGQGLMNLLLEVSGKSKQEECDNSQLEYYLDYEVETPLLLQKLQRSLKATLMENQLQTAFPWKYMCPGSYQRHKAVCHFSSDNETHLTSFFTQSSHPYSFQACFTQHNQGRTRLLQGSMSHLNDHKQQQEDRVSGQS